MFDVPEFLARCIFYDRSPAAETSRFKHRNHDELCKDILTQLEVIAGFCQRDKVHPSITQGPRDQGGDVIFKYANEEKKGLVVIQVKTEIELDADLSKSLKAAFFDSVGHYKDMSRYYIALFGDSTSKAKRIKAICTEFTNADLARVVEPEYLATFLSLNAVQVEGVYQRLVGIEKWTYEAAAMSDVKLFDDDNLFFALACMFYYFENRNESLPESFYLSDDRLKERFDSQQIANLRSNHADSLLEIWASAEEDRLRTELLPGVEVMYRSLVSEKQWDADTAFEYMFSFLRRPTEEYR
jgi:hypothetical protein